MTTLEERFADPRPIVLDGAMGTELDRRGMPLVGGAWSAHAALTHPDLVRAIHADYARAGAEIHLTSTFAANRHVLALIGEGDRVGAANRTAVTLCREAIESAGVDRPQWIAGAVSTYAKGSDRSTLPPPDRFGANIAEQGDALAESGVVLFALEMLFDAEYSIAMIEALAPLGLPLWLGFTCKLNKEGEVVADGGGYRGKAAITFDRVLPDVLAAVPNGAEVLVSVMHNELDETDQALDIVARHWAGPVVVYPNSGRYGHPRWDFDTVCAPAEFADAAERWAARGVRVIGGCCGLGPAHIAALVERLNG